MKLKRPGPNGEEYIIQPPCGDGDNWGCNRLVKDLNVLTDGKVAADLDTTPFNWRQPKAVGKVAVTQSPTPADNESDPGASDPGQVKPPPKHPSQSKKPGTSHDEQDPSIRGDGEDHPGQGGDDDDNPSTGTKPKPKPKPKGNGRTRRHFYA
ncbi:hypothetical protein X797_012343 [Metarhizium robertsii]|uniref:Uncharacterized protein n=2 Tax=Metarhizium robertsii TaxID=568076 RepID=E9F8G3_METRA|nr:uncharacterized protein MAA_08562 [Metarhizium robertsii ARSEF 23]EFY95909.1 hypothetical protein MAA_08562 [Metarhizium robertsii ARSEF 23]EXU94587.1 hypothetical protein X797_012343 [Metarhizium robertsii]